MKTYEEYVYEYLNNTDPTPDQPVFDFSLWVTAQWLKDNNLSVNKGESCQSLNESAEPRLKQLEKMDLRLYETIRKGISTYNNILEERRGLRKTVANGPYDLYGYQKNDMPGVFTAKLVGKVLRPIVGKFHSDWRKNAYFLFEDGRKIIADYWDPLFDRDLETIFKLTYEMQEFGFAWLENIEISPSQEFKSPLWVISDGRWKRKSEIN